MILKFHHSFCMKLQQDKNGIMSGRYLLQKISECEKYYHAYSFQTAYHVSKKCKMHWAIKVLSRVSKIQISESWKITFGKKSFRM